MTPLGAMAIGAGAGAVCALAVGLKYHFGYDDSLDVVGVHFVGGVVGMLGIGLLASAAAPAAVDGLLYGGGAGQLGKQVVATLATMTYSFLVTSLLARGLDRTLGFRVDEEHESDRGRPRAARGDGLRPPPDRRRRSAASRRLSDRRTRGRAMKLVTAVIKPHKWEEVRAALEALGITGMTVSEVSGYGRQKGHTEVYRGAEYDINLVPKVRLDIVVDTEDADDVVSTIVSVAKTGRIGDGKVWVTAVESVVRVRTDDRDEAAL